MIIAKNGTQYNEITNEIIKAHATYVNSPFAKIQRDLNYQTIGENEFSYDKLIDNFTADELKAGFFEVAKVADNETLELYSNKFFSGDLEIQRYIKLNQLKNIKDAKLSEFNFQDKIYQIDTKSKLNINGKVSEIILKSTTDQPITSIVWIAKDNTSNTFTQNEFMAFATAVAAHTEAVIFKHDQLRTAVNNATSIDEIKAIEWVD